MMGLNNYINGLVKMLNSTISIVVFSKDRACQLDLTLRSIIKYMKLPFTLSTIYLSTSDEFNAGYEILKDLYKFEFIKQSNLKKDLLSVIDTDLKYYFGMCDDTLLIRNLEYDTIFETFENNQDIMTINLRLGKNVFHNYFEDTVKIQQPKFNKDNTYDWRSINNPHWNHPMTSYGHICRLDEIKSIVEMSEFENVNVLENRIINLAKYKSLNICYDKHRTVELCANMVNTTHLTNICGNISIVDLNNRWLDGYRINLESLDYTIGNHQRFPNIEFKYYKR